MSGRPPEFHDPNVLVAAAPDMPPVVSSSSTTSDRGHVPVLDALRFIAAFWVVISHAGLPPLPASLADSRTAYLARVALGAPFCGIAAVMLFFVISGFCIHYPFARGRPLLVGRFYAARFTRIGLPLVAALLIFLPTGLLPELHLILWSIFCEILYYLFYPLLALGIKRWGAFRMVIASATVTFLSLGTFIALHGGLSGNFASWGAIGTSLIGLPVWLGGCLLASIVVNTPPNPLLKTRSRFSTWTWRFGMLGIISGCNIAHFHTPLNYKLSMPVIGLLCVPWIWHEMQHTRPPNWLVSAGQAGYSIYLMHQLGVHGIDCLNWPLTSSLCWLIGILAAALTISVFFFLVEKPSHRLAKRLGRTPTPHPTR